jgi:hypothetical protein
LILFAFLIALSKFKLTAMSYVKKVIASWEVKYGQINISGKDNVLAREIFKDYLGKTFEMETFRGSFRDLNFNDRSSTTSLRLSCSDFFKHLKEGDIIYLRPKDADTIQIYEQEPGEKSVPKIELPTETGSKFSQQELLETIALLSKENHELRETNSSLFVYKERLERYEGLHKIFNDEKFMEDWLERNIHKAIADLEIIDRQPIITWPLSKLKNRLDFFCVDKTTRELVIVENKVRGNKTTLETQYLSYKAWVTENLDLINSKYSAISIKATNSFKFVIITDFNDERLESICRHNKITLLVIDGGVIFEELGYPYGK